jgi:hypothetical protein
LYETQAVEFAVITTHILWDAIASADRDAEQQDPPGRTSPEETRAILEYVFSVASEERPLSLADYHAFHAGLDHGVGHLLSTTTTDHQRRNPTEG